MGLASETDHLPIGEVRKLWVSYALKEKDLEIARAEEMYRSDFLETCRRIVKRNCSVDAVKSGCINSYLSMTNRPKVEAIFMAGRPEILQPARLCIGLVSRQCSSACPCYRQSRI